PAGTPPPNSCWICRIDGYAETAGPRMNADWLCGDDVAGRLNSGRRAHRNGRKHEGQDCEEDSVAYCERNQLQIHDVASPRGFARVGAPETEIRGDIAA